MYNCPKCYHRWKNGFTCPNCGWQWSKWTASIKRAERNRSRKDQVETLLAKAQGRDGYEAVQAWQRLCRELGHMTHPEARMPRYKGLLHALWIAASNDQT